MNSTLSNLRNELRKSIREKRNSLTDKQQSLASATVCKRLSNHPLYLESQHIAFFIAADGEINLQQLLEIAQAQDKCCYLPLINKSTGNSLQFYRYVEGDELVKTRLGVLEPTRNREEISPDQLDLVLNPLVAFDNQANRMGMGKGFYDRTFEFKLDPAFRGKSPFLLGIAHECQRVERLETADWDVPLDAVITSESVYGTLKITH